MNADRPNAVVPALLAVSLCLSTWGGVFFSPMWPVGKARAEGVARAQAQPATRAQVIVVLASEQPGQFDPGLASIPALRKPPFSAFKSMKVLSQPMVNLVAGRAVTQPLPNGRHLQLEMLQRMPDGRIKVRVSINRPKQKDYLRLLEVLASPGEPFFVAGQRYQGGTLVIGVRIRR